MGQAAVEYIEIRFDVRNPETTNVYVLCRGLGDCPHFIDGWHHKAFPAGISMQEIINNHLWKDEDPILWEHKAPEEHQNDPKPHMLPTPPKEMTITINGKEQIITTGGLMYWTFWYRDVVTLAGKDADKLYSVTYSTSDPNHPPTTGMITPEQGTLIPTTSRVVFNVYHTSNA